MSKTSRHKVLHPAPGPRQGPLIFLKQSQKLIMDNDALDHLLAGKDPALRNFARRRLKLLFDRCSKKFREGNISLEAVNGLGNFCLDILPLIEDERIVMPTAGEIALLFDWYVNMPPPVARQEPAVVLTTVCPDYPYDRVDASAVFKNGGVGDGIGLIGESIMNHAPELLQILASSLNISLVWIVGYAGFEAKPDNLAGMKISPAEFRNKLETSALKLQQKMGVSVGVLPDAANLSEAQFAEIRDGFSVDDFNIKRSGMDALADAVDVRDWAGVFVIANRLNAIIVDGASVYMGRRAYKNAARILQADNPTPRFFCVCDYMGFAG